MSYPFQHSTRIPFPTDALPPKIRNAVEEGIRVMQAPPALIASSALAAASHAVQSKFEVERLNGLKGPCSAYFIIIAESGERKSTADAMYFRAAREFEETASKKYKCIVSVLVGDSTPAGTIAHMDHYSPSVCLCEDEAGRIFSSNLVNDLGLLNKTWGGNSITVDRKYERLVVLSPRCSLIWMVQPTIFEKFMQRRGDDARGIGFLARCHVCYPESTQGSRFIKPRPEELVYVNDFKQRCLDLLHEQVERFLPGANQKRFENVTLTFAYPAQIAWEQIYDNIEFACATGGVFAQNRDYASKIAENIARMAGVFHAFEGHEGTEISEETLHRAAQVVLWYAAEFLRLFTPPGPVDILNDHALKLDNWLIEYAFRTGSYTVAKSFLLRYGPNSLRNRDTLELAIQRLMETNRISHFPAHMLSNNQMSRKATKMLFLHDNYYGQIVRGQQVMHVLPLLQ